MQKSDSINEIAAALAKAQSKMSLAERDSKNPFFNSSYADLASVWEACRAPLTENGLSVVQFPSAEGNVVTVDTLLLHSSGQWFSSTLAVVSKKDDAQGIGSVITYLRRYSLQSMVGVAPDDDDGNASVGGPPQKQSAKSQDAQATRPINPSGNVMDGPPPLLTEADAAYIEKAAESFRSCKSKQEAVALWDDMKDKSPQIKTALHKVYTEVKKSFESAA